VEKDSSNGGLYPYSIQITGKMKELGCATACTFTGSVGGVSSPAKGHCGSLW